MTRSRLPRSRPCPTEPGRFVSPSPPRPVRSTASATSASPDRKRCRRTLRAKRSRSSSASRSSPTEVEAAEANVLLRLPQQGYPFPELGLRDIELDPATQLGDLHAAGRARSARELRRLHHRGRPRLRRRACRRPRPLRAAASSTTVAWSTICARRWSSTRLFASVSAEPVRTGETAPDGTEYVNILVRQEAGPARSFDATAGYSTGEGFRVEGAWEHRNLFPPEGSLRDRRDSGHRRAESQHPLPAQQLAAARPRHPAPAGSRAARLRGLPGLHRPPARPDHARIDADLAEGLDLLLWCRDPRHQREPRRQARISRSATPSSSAA